MTVADTQGDLQTADEGPGEPLTYGTYLRVPELLGLQRALAPGDAPDEMLFIILQQSQELWFKQILHDLARVVQLLDVGQLDGATALINRCSRILHVLAEEVEVMETLPPQEFQRFRHVLKTASGFESQQFRELEFASGLKDEAHSRVMRKFLDATALDERWPITVRDAWLARLENIAGDPADAVLRVYEHPENHEREYRLAEALADYDLRFAAWRFHHMVLVERVIGSFAAGTGGSSGSGYLSRTVQYRCFPELWDARSRLTERHAHATS